MRSIFIKCPIIVRALGFTSIKNLACLPLQVGLASKLAQVGCCRFSTKSFDRKKVSLRPSQDECFQRPDIDHSIGIDSEEKSDTEVGHYGAMIKAAEICLHPFLEIENWDESLFESLLADYKRVMPHASRQVVEHSLIALCKKYEVVRPARLLLEDRAASSLQVPAATLALYVELCGLCYEKQSKIGATDSELFNEIIDHMMKVKEQLSGYAVLDRVSVNRLVSGFCSVGHWRVALQCLRRWSSDGFAKNDYNKIIKAAFAAGDLEAGRLVFTEVINDWHSVSSGAMIQWLNTIEQNSFQDARADLVTGLDSCPRPGDHVHRSLLVSETEFLKFMRHLLRFNHPVESDLAARILDVCTKKLPQPWQGMATFVSNSGVCEYCGSTLPQMRMADEEFAQLREAFLSRVLIGDDIYLKSDPGELARFCHFVKQNAPFDHIVDGLNIVYFNNLKTYDPVILAHFVNYMSEMEANNILVVTRPHSLRDRDIRSYVQSKAHLFMARDSSSDDTLMLYALFLSDQHTRIYTRDKFRDHAKYLSLPLRHNFNRLMLTNRVSVRHFKTDNSFQLEKSYSHDLRTHYDGDGVWHVPFHSLNSRVQAFNIAPPLDVNFGNRWLCLRQPRP